MTKKRQIKHYLSGECSAHDITSANAEQLRKYNATLQCLNCGGHNGNM